MFGFLRRRHSPEERIREDGETRFALWEARQHETPSIQFLADALMYSVCTILNPKAESKWRKERGLESHLLGRRFSHEFWRHYGKAVSLLELWTFAIFLADHSQPENARPEYRQGVLAALRDAMSSEMGMVFPKDLIEKVVQNRFIIYGAVLQRGDGLDHLVFELKNLMHASGGDSEPKIFETTGIPIVIADCFADHALQTRLAAFMQVWAPKIERLVRDVHHAETARS